MKATQRWRLPGIGGLLSVAATCFSPLCYAQDAARDANNANNRYTFIGFVRNVFDDEGFESAGATQSAWGVRSLNVSPTAPRVRNRSAIPFWRLSGMQETNKRNHGFNGSSIWADLRNSSAGSFFPNDGRKRREMYSVQQACCALLLATKGASTIEATAERLSIPFITKHRAVDFARFGGSHEYVSARDAVQCHGQSPVRRRDCARTGHSTDAG